MGQVVKLQVTGASQVRRFFHDDAHRKCGVAPELGDRSLAPTHSLAHLEALELRMVDVERLVLARILVGGAEFLRPCPGFECRLALPNGVRGIEREVLVLGSLEQVEFDEAGHLGQLRIAAEPYFLEGLFGTFLHAEAVMAMNMAWSSVSTGPASTWE